MMKLTTGIIFLSVVITVAFGFGASHQNEDGDNGEREISMEELGDWLGSMKNWTDIETNLPKNMPSGSRVVDTRGIRFLLFYNYDSSSSSRYCNSTDNIPTYCWTEIKMDDPSTIPPSFNPAYPVKFLVHGWCQTWQRHFPQVVIKSYLKKKSKANIIVVDWESLATICTCSIKRSDNRAAVQGAELFSYYYTAAGNTPAVGAYIAEFIDFLTDNKYTVPEKTHCIGHSLGGHICGYAGQAVYKTMDGCSMSRITGLDPAGLLFYTNSIGRRLTPNDAEFVDVIHSDDRVLGNDFTMGHVDFYPNGGHAYQPFCADMLDDAVSIGPMQLFQLICKYKYADLFCGHMKAPTYFAMSILSEIPVYRCSDVAYAMVDGGRYCNPNPSRSVVMGEYCPRNAEGWYYTTVRKRD